MLKTQILSKTFDSKKNKYRRKMVCFLGTFLVCVVCVCVCVCVCVFYYFFFFGGGGVTKRGITGMKGEV